MKRLVGVIILAGAPIACGTSNPSAPETLSLGDTGSDASVASLAKRPTRPPVPTTCGVASEDVRLDGIHLTVRGAGDGYVTLRADAVVLGDSDRLTPCFTPEWSFGPQIRGASLGTGRDPQVATLAGPAGKYEVQASWQSGDGRRIVGSLTVAID